MDNIFLSHSYCTHIPTKISLQHNTDTNLHNTVSCVTLLGMTLFPLHCIALQEKCPLFFQVFQIYLSFHVYGLQPLRLGVVFFFKILRCLVCKCYSCTSVASFSMKGSANLSDITSQWFTNVLCELYKGGDVLVLVLQRETGIWGRDHFTDGDRAFCLSK